MNGQRTPVVDTSPLGIVKAIDAQRATRPYCTIALMPAQADVVRALLIVEADAAAVRDAKASEEARARALVAEMEGEPSALAAALADRGLS